MEEWKPIEWYEGLYEISNKWIIISLVNWRRKINRVKILKPSITTTWYYFVNLYKHWIVRSKMIHRLVALTFIPNPENKPQVNHKDWNKLNNSLENLEWVTSSENVQHAWNTGLRKINENCYFIKNKPSKWLFWWKHPRSRRVLQYNKEWILIKKFNSLIEAWEYTVISRSSISECCSWKLKSAGGFIWKYEINA